MRQHETFDQHLARRLVDFYLGHGAANRIRAIRDGHPSTDCFGSGRSGCGRWPFLPARLLHDCGLVINPDGLKNQIEGNIIQGVSRALMEEVKFDSTGITSLDWRTYPVIRFPDIPEIDIVLINRPEMPALGGGEPSSAPIAAAIANAIFDATGVRLREAPFTPERVLAGLKKT